MPADVQTGTEKPSSPATLPAIRLATLSIVATFSAALLILGVPRAVSAYLAISGQPVKESMDAGQPVGDDLLRAYVQSRAEAAAWGGAPSYYFQRGAALLRLAVDRNGPRPDDWLLNSAITAFHAGLARSPANSSAWVQLALAQYLKDGASPMAARALRMSMMVGRHAPEIVFMRLELALRNWRYIELRDRTAVLHQVRQAWSAAPRRLVGMARGRHQLAVIRAGLASDPGALQRFESARKRVVSQRR